MARQLTASPDRCLVSCLAPDGLSDIGARRTVLGHDAFDSILTPWFACGG